MSKITRTDRIEGALKGQFVGDALCLGTHWLYNLRERARRYPKGIVGFERPAADHYHGSRAPGDGTHYADAAEVLLASVVERNGLDVRDYGRRLIARYGDPGYDGFLDKPTRILLEREREWGLRNPGQPYSFADGANDEQTVTMSRLAPVVVAHSRDGDLMERVEACVRVCQNNDRAVVHAQVYARVLARLLDGAPLLDAAAEAIETAPAPYAREIGERWDDARAMAELPAIHATGEVGRSCYLPSTFPAILHVIVRHGDDLATALLQTVRAGGDSASRAAVVGTWLGAVHGAGEVPPCWWGKLTARPYLEPRIAELAARHG